MAHRNRIQAGVMQGPRKTYLAAGTLEEKAHWIEREASPILNCKCGNKYLKTRPKQETCLPCMYGHFGGDMKTYNLY